MAHIMNITGVIYCVLARCQFVYELSEDGTDAPKHVGVSKDRTVVMAICAFVWSYRGADKSLSRPTSRYILFDGENISFDDSLVIYINSTNILPIMIINRI
jgi:homoserine trans-succinylase